MQVEFSGKYSGNEEEGIFKENDWQHFRSNAKLESTDIRS